MEVNKFGINNVRDLISNERDIVVTEETKFEYIRLVCQMKTTGAIRKQFNGSGALQGFDQSDRAKFLQFVTGTSKVPLQGFAVYKSFKFTEKIGQQTGFYLHILVLFNWICQCMRRMINSIQIYSRRFMNAAKDLDLHKLVGALLSYIM